MAQSRPGPAYFLHHPATTAVSRFDVVLLPVSPAKALSAGAPIPTVRAAAAYAPLHPPASLPTAAPAPAPRRDLTGVWAYPPYDPYQNLPEAFRKNTLPDVWAAPLPVQLLRSALGQPSLPGVPGQR